MGGGFKCNLFIHCVNIWRPVNCCDCFFSVSPKRGSKQWKNQCTHREKTKKNQRTAWNFPFDRRVKIILWVKRIRDSPAVTAAARRHVRQPRCRNTRRGWDSTQLNTTLFKVHVNWDGSILHARSGGMTRTWRRPFIVCPSFQMRLDEVHVVTAEQEGQKQSPKDVLPQRPRARPSGRSNVF